MDVIGTIKRIFEEMDIPFTWLTENQETEGFYKKEDGTAKISTIDSSKGMDFQALFMVNADNIPFALEEEENREVALMYIRMTRAIEYLTISYSGDPNFTEYYDEFVEKRKMIKIRRNQKSLKCNLFVHWNKIGGK